MTTAEQYFIQAEFAQTAYGTYSIGAIDINLLTGSDVGMTTDQATRFASTYTVLDQYTDTVTGVSATIFEKAGQRYVAVRGTEASITDILADAVLAAGVPAKLNQQYQALTAQMDAWLAAPSKLGGKTFTVTGHSLGGYLAEAIKEAYPAAAAYLYNAPGAGGLIGNFADLVSALFNQSAPGANNTWNIKGSEGASFITGHGGQPSGSIPIQIEADPSLGFDNHSIVRLVDALAIQSLYAALDPNLTQDQLNALIDASGSNANDVLESALDALRKLSQGSTDSTAPGNRDSLYTNRYALQDSSAYQSLTGNAQITDLTANDSATLTAKASQTDAEGLAYRYALTTLNPFAVIGADYSLHNTNGALDRYDESTGTGQLSDQYLTDRAKRNLLRSTPTISQKFSLTDAGNKPGGGFNDHNWRAVA